MEVLPTCRFFEPKAGECTFRVQAARFLAPYVEEQRVLFRRGAENGDLILALEDAPRQLPSQADYPDQFAYMEGYARCKASDEISPGQYAPNVELQQQCNRYFGPGVITEADIRSASTVLFENKKNKLFLPPQKP